MENLAFSFDASFGDFLTTLAREKIMTEYDLDAAVKILTDSLSGMSRDQALHILSGECDLSVTSDGSLRSWLHRRIANSLYSTGCAPRDRRWRIHAKHGGRLPPRIETTFLSRRYR